MFRKYNSYFLTTVIILQITLSIKQIKQGEKLILNSTFIRRVFLSNEITSLFIDFF